MKVSQAYRQYLVIAVFPLVGLFIYGKNNNLLVGYLLGMALAIIQITFAFVKGNVIADTYAGRKNKKILLTKSMFGSIFLILGSFIIVYKFLGTFALYGCATATLLQRPAWFMLLKKTK